MEDNILSKIKSILGMPVAESKEEVTAQIPEQNAPVTQVEVQLEETVTQDENKTPAIEELLSAISDLQNRFTLLESQLTLQKEELSKANEVQQKVNKVVELIASQPSGEVPKRTESSFSKVSDNSKLSKEELKLKRMALLNNAGK